ncbi:DNA polymerase III subunit alpha [Alphaproteobacteria bacterium SO-S41]|nr:DNA polymerase III subunit alpha [Alphaproteobacteria bacterium SO-S41]
MPPFVHLRVHSAYSLLEGAIRVKELAELCAKGGMPAVAVTDTNNLFGAVEIADTLAGRGVQPIMGLTLSVELGREKDRSRPGAAMERPQIALLAQNEAGWLNLSRLSSKSFLDVHAPDTTHVTLDVLEAHAEGLILLSGGPRGPLNRLIVEGRPADASELAARFAAAFPNRFYIELQRHGAPSEKTAEPVLIDIAYARRLPLVATNECFFGNEGMYEAHDALLCIAAGRYVNEDDRPRVTSEHRFKSAEEMTALFADLPEAIANTVEIAKRCAYRPIKRKPILPDFPVPAGHTAPEELRLLAHAGLTTRLETFPLFKPREDYFKRLDYELDVITRMGFEGYFLIVSDFMKWTRSQGIPVGVRGSGATSIAAWALDITSLDPLRFNLVFERFLNPERVSMPDFDIDFCQERRGEVIRYVQGKYGVDRVAQIITFGTLAARACLRDVGRVLQMGYNFVDRICKMVPNQPGKQVTLREAVNADPKLRDLIRNDDGVARLFEVAEKLEGLYRNASTHAAGLVIGDRPLPELVPLYHDQKADLPASQFDYKDAETVGLVKFDFLGLKTLTVIAETEKLLAARGLAIRTGDEMKFDDRRTYEMLSRGDTIGVFQLESQGMRDLIRRLKPDRIEDIIALVALYRPGPMDSIPKYIACKNGREEVTYLHPLLEPILNDTYGVMTYQEDVMMIARELAGYSLGDADLLRRAMGKKDKDEMARQKARFVAGAKERGIIKDTAEEIFQQADKFAGYGFNKGHAAAYAQVAYQTAFLKANYPAEFLCASMTLDMGDTTKLNIYRQEAERLGIKVLPPDVNASTAVFSVEYGEDGKAAIRYALGAIRNVGRQAMERVVAARASGPFKTLFDFARRVDSRLVNKRALENLSSAGAFDSITPNRAQVFAAAELMLAHSDSEHRERESGQVSLFGGADQVKDPKLPIKGVWDSSERLQREFEAIGFYLSGHPLDDYALALKRLGVKTWAQAGMSGKQEGGAVSLAGIILDRKDKQGRDPGRPYAFIRISDQTAVFETTVFSELLAANDELLRPGAAVVFTVTIDWEDDQPRLRTHAVKSLNDAAKSTSAGLKITLDAPKAMAPLRGILEPRKGKGRVSLALMLDGGRSAEIDIGRYAVTPDLRRAIRALTGVVEVEEV